ncbi:MAG: hypothetical protein M3Y21_11545 [Candidatus Eremiobacteraeota bacterium]|nr:hypothetical protein [Candidatus Eremiobacteraeota bacterium]
MIDKRILFAGAAFALAACSGNFSNGTSLPGGVTPPLNGNSIPAPFASSSPGTAATALPKGGIIKGNTGTFSVADASGGLQCPTIDGYGCVLSFNLPTPAPTTNPKSKHTKSKSTPSPSPTPTPAPTLTPTPTPIPTAAPTIVGVLPGGSFVTPPPSAATTASALALTGDTVSITLNPKPKDAPKMTDPDPTALATTALMDVRLIASAPFIINGDARMQFTLPKEQIPGRGFAIQIFSDSEGKHHKHTYAPLYAASKSTLDQQTLTFNFTPPSTTLPKGQAFLIVLYGDEKPSATANPHASASPSAAPATVPTAIPSASPAPLPSPKHF